MATFKAVVQKQRKDGLWPVYIRVSQGAGKVGYLKTNKLVDSKGCNKKHEVTDPFVMKYCSDRIADYVDSLNRVETESWTPRQIIDYVKDAKKDICFSDYARKHNLELIKKGQRRNARNYEFAYQHLERYAGTTKVMFSHLTTMFIGNWIKSMEGSARCKEMYPICIRQIWKAAVAEYNDYDNDIIRIKTNPWLKVKIPKADTPEKRAITMEACRDFFNAPIPESRMKYPLAEVGRDVAMMILCLAGINTADIFQLRKDGYKDGIIGYERAKTRRSRADNAYIEMRVPDILIPIINKYRDETDSEYLLNFHQRLSTQDSFNANVNIGIRQICEKQLGIKHEDAYSAYTFRHTWATIAQNECGATEAEVGFAMNHSTNRVTRGYIKQVDFSPAWELNERVIEKIFFTEDKSKRQEQKERKQLIRFSYRHLVRGTVYHRGRIVAKVEDVGFNNVEEVIRKLMAMLPEDMPNRSMVQIRIENTDSGVTQFYERQVRR